MGVWSALTHIMDMWSSGSQCALPGSGSLARRSMVTWVARISLAHAGGSGPQGKPLRSVVSAARPAERSPWLNSCGLYIGGKTPLMTSMAEAARARRRSGSRTRSGRGCRARPSAALWPRPTSYAVADDSGPRSRPSKIADRVVRGAGRTYCPRTCGPQASSLTFGSPCRTRMPPDTSPTGSTSRRLSGCRARFSAASWPRRILLAPADDSGPQGKPAKTADSDVYIVDALPCRDSCGPPAGWVSFTSIEKIRKAPPKRASTRPASFCATTTT
mmetsp:Transcript_101289/g.291761  ORF Transcript_101289/g.291761 Transcript_101289/m.291761 type:complete len:273 (+) Transcript_101289:146-964(+)